MKRMISLLLVLTLTAGVLAGCGRQNAPTASDDTKLSIVTTIFPEYDWVREIVGEKADHAEITMLLDSGVDLHSYQPTAADMIKISDCDLFIYVGGESDRWVADALQEAVKEASLSKNPVLFITGVWPSGKTDYKAIKVGE